ncbi:hypothetical protein BDM02DRAFT_3110918 [Thelephora ganbajun]|uniref:Uncharacterized protein n=1 Tax=Thelephora ganbajun TaxID=370292 RepID=A0ACB6ZPZ4_THEGA|nr:hypothetical protein BDM02DRAFT_3110918 [Thelephora ganbajun]
MGPPGSRSRQCPVPYGATRSSRFGIHSTWNAFKKPVVDGDHGKLTSMGDVAIKFVAFYDKVDFLCIQFVGHSFGGATLFHISSTPPGEGFSPLLVSHALFLDSAFRGVHIA